MKKFYALALAAAVALSASAAIEGGRQAVREAKVLGEAVAIEAPQKGLNLREVTKSSVRKAPRKVSVADLEVQGKYMNFYTAQTQAGTYRTFSDLVEIYEDDFENLLLYNFFGEGQDVEVSFDDVEWSVAGSEEKVELPTLIIPAGSEIFVEDGNSYGAYFFDQEYLYSSIDIEFIYNEQTKSFVWPYDPTLDWGIFVGYAGDDGYYHGFTVANPEFDAMNGLAEGIGSGFIGEDYIEDEVPFTQDVLGQKNETSLKIYGFIESPDYLEFTLDETTKTAVAKDQIFGVNSNYGTYYWASYNEAGTVNLGVMNATYTEENDKLVLTLTDYIWAVYIPSLEAPLTYGYDTTLTFDFSVAAGVKDVIGNVDNANAPVEFFNLQGIRVSEPAAGNIYIRRQGSDVQKIVIR